MKKLFFLWHGLFCLLTAAEPVLPHLEDLKNEGISELNTRHDSSGAGINNSTISIPSINKDAVNHTIQFSEATDAAPPTPSGFALIPAGNFQMGDSLDGLPNAPTHDVKVDPFYMGKYEITKELWDEVRAWGLNHGYTDLPLGNGSYASKGANHPVHSIDWYAMVKWCNARSEKDGLVSCYYTNAEQTRASIYKSGVTTIDNTMVKWSANGYRLPTEAEWEKAARGGLIGKRFPWGDSNVIIHAQANYYSNHSYPYDVSRTREFHPVYAIGGYPYSSPVGSFVESANDYWLYDMAGNMWEWCWDWYGPYVLDRQTNPRGPATGSARVSRGGSWYGSAGYCRVAVRDYYLPSETSLNIGFRVIRSSIR